MSETLGLFRRSSSDDALLTLMKKGFVEHANSSSAAFSIDEAAELSAQLDKLSRLQRFLVVRAIRQEAKDQGVSLKAIDWESIGDFIVKIAPIIKMFLELLM